MNNKQLARKIDIVTVPFMHLDVMTSTISLWSLNIFYHTDASIIDKALAIESTILKLYKNI